MAVTTNLSSVSSSVLANRNSQTPKAPARFGWTRLAIGAGLALLSATTALAGPTERARTAPSGQDPVVSFKDGRVLFADGVVMSIHGGPASGGDPFDLGPMAACFAEGSNPTLEQMRALNQAIEASGYGSRYNRSDRWGSTVIGAVGAVGDPITITWSFIPDGTAINDGFGNDVSSLFADMDTKFAGNRALWITQFVNSFARISALTGIEYVRVTSGGNEWDDGAAWGTGGGSNGTGRGMVRIGMKQIDNGGGILAYNQFPDNGDMVIDEDDNWGSSGNTYRFLRNTIMHEHGHGLGFAHVCPSGALMAPFLSTSFDGPQQDDIRGMQANYGDPSENNDTQATAFDLGTPTVGSSTTYGSIPSPAVTNAANLSLNPGGSNTATTDNDTDWYRITTLDQRLVDITVTPIGSNYADYDQNQDGSCQNGAANMDALAQADLQLQVNSGTGAIALRTQNATAAGAAEVISGLLLNSGLNTFRVNAASNFTNAQAYRITINVRNTNLAPSATDGTLTTGVRVTWPTVPDSTNFFVYRSTVDDVATSAGVSGTLPGTATNFEDTTAVPGTNYFYWVRVTQTGAATQRLLANAGEPGFRNIAPIANAGPDQVLALGNGQTTRAVTLDGSGSSDPDGSISGFNWSINGSPVATGVNPTINLAAGSYTILLTVADNRSALGTDTVQITINNATNQLPVANAGTDQTQTLAVGASTASISLSGLGSTDPDGSIVSYAWSLAGTPLATGATPTVNLPQGVHIVTLLVTDNAGATDDDTVTVTVNEAPNVPPVADAGTDQTVTLASGASTAPVTLSATSSTDPDGGGIVAYAWSIDGVPVATGVSPTINLPEGVHVVTLLVTDNRGGTDDDSVTITVNAPSNSDPIANAGPDQTLSLEGDALDISVTMDGTASTDTDGSIVSYSWLLNAQTVGTGPAPTLLLTEGVSEITLIVTDNLGATGFDSVVVTVGRSCNYDFNQDENVDLLDAQQMAQVFVGSLSPEANWLTGDLNRDENADLTDAQLLAQFVVTGSCAF